MSLVTVIDAQINKANTDQIGVIASNIYQFYDQGLAEFTWVFDVDLQIASTNPNVAEFETLKAVPIDDPSREVYDAAIGTKVSLSKQLNGTKWVITGLAKIAPGTLTVCLVKITDTDITIQDPVVFGSNIRLLTYDELGPFGGGYGNLPYDTVGKFDINGNLIKLILPQ